LLNLPQWSRWAIGAGELMGRERDEIEKVLTKLSRLVGDYGERILASLNVVATIDCIVARAKLSLLQGGVGAYSQQCWPD
jgi:dsDNA-specific endonuclease/ATPase MutS2